MQGKTQSWDIDKGQIGLLMQDNNFVQSLNDIATILSGIHKADNYCLLTKKCCKLSEKFYETRVSKITSSTIIGENCRNILAPQRRIWTAIASPPEQTWEIGTMVDRMMAD